MSLKGIFAKMVPCLGADATEAAASSRTAVENVTPESAQNLVREQGVKVVDIRTQSEFATGHIPGAVNIDFHAANFEESLRSLDPEQPYIVHCAAGGRSTKSLPSFRKIGFKTIYHLNGGIQAWNDSRLSLEK